MPRPRGEVREALAVALEQLHKVQGAVSARELAAAAKVSIDHAEKTLENMAIAGQVAVVGHGKRPGERWHNLYEPAGDDVDESADDPLTAVMRSFVPTAVLD